MKKLDIIAALVLLGLSALIVWDTWDLPYWDRFSPGSSFAPIWVAAAGVLIAVLLLVQAVRTRNDEPAEWPDGAGLRRVVMSIATIGLILVAFPWLGTVVSGTLFMLLFLIGVARRPIVPSLAATFITVALVESVFGLWLKIDLPSGIVGF